MNIILKKQGVLGLRSLFCCLFLGVSVMAYAHNNLILNVEMNNPHVEVTLPANPTTGFQWSIVRFDKKLLILKSSSYERSKTNLIGAGGQMHFIFTLQERKNYPKSTELVFKYARSWERSSATLKKITVTFVKTDKT